MDHTTELYEFAARVGERFRVAHLVDALDREESRRDQLDLRFKPLLIEGAEDALAEAGVLWRPNEPLSGRALESRLMTIRDALHCAPLSVVALPLSANETSHPAGPAEALVDLRATLGRIDLEPEFLGLSPSPPERPMWAVAVLAAGRPPVRAAPVEFRVGAIMTAYNEHDIIRPTVEHLLNAGVNVHLIDNWSTDGTVDQVRDYIERGLITVERFPVEGPPTMYDWTGLLGRVAEVAKTLDAEWCIHHDIDQRRDGPWPGSNIRDAIYRVNQWGFNAIDHTIVEFRPVDNDYPDGAELTSYFRRFEFVPGSATAAHVQAWKNDHLVDLVSSGGHDVQFPGRQVFPFNFLLRHYPVRSQHHGERKVFTERQSRYPREELDRGWHHHYNRLRRGHSFVRGERDLIEFDETFYERYLLPCLARVDVPLEPLTGWRKARPSAVRSLRRLGLLAWYVELRRRLRRGTRALRH